MSNPSKPICIAAIIIMMLWGQTAMGTEKTVILKCAPDASQRIYYGIAQLTNSLKSLGWHVFQPDEQSSQKASSLILVQTQGAGKSVPDVVNQYEAQAEGFTLICRSDRTAIVVGDDDAGALYGCLELAERFRASEGDWPAAFTFHDAPKLRLRGPCIGLQRPDKIYDDMMYDYRYLPKTFPWFYDREHWTRVLDLLARYRFNALYLWNGHPFTSILKLEKYPEAQEVDTEQLEKNIELFKWLCDEADRRNIWIVQNHYNIHISHALARYHNIDYHHKHITPLLAEYSSYCYSEFIKNYPHVGLMMCLGEALQDDTEWLTQVVIPAVQSALEPGQAEPPIIVRGHSTPIFEVMAAAKPLYSNLYITAKYNNETLASDKLGGGTDPAVTRHYPWEVGGQAHVELAKLAPLITNIHCVANLEPFRWGDTDFMQRAITDCVKSGVQGLHVYPPRYWDWPWSADRCEPRLEQVQRDWIWFAGWARYSWNPFRDREKENEFWTGELAQRYGNEQAGRYMLLAYQQSGEVLPQTTRAFAVTSENFLANALGETLEQLFVSERWYEPIHGETIYRYAEREALGRRHIGQTPLEAADMIVAHAQKALENARQAKPFVTQNPAEFERWFDDIQALDYIAQFYRHKIRAATAGLEFVYTGNLEQLDTLEKELADSVTVYDQLAHLTDRRYLDCTGRHDSGRCYPYPAPEVLVWSDVLPKFRQELELVRHNAQYIRKQKLQPLKVYPAVDIRALDKDQDVVEVAFAQSPYTERSKAMERAVREVPAELIGLKTIRYSRYKQRETSIHIPFEADVPVRAFIYVSEDCPAPAGWSAYQCSGAKTTDGSIYTRDFPAGQTDITFCKPMPYLIGFTKQGIPLLPEDSRRMITPEFFTTKFESSNSK